MNTNMSNELLDNKNILYTKGQINSLKEQIDLLKSEVVTIKNILNENHDYYKFCTETNIGHNYNEKIEEIFNLLDKISKSSEVLIDNTKKYLNKQKDDDENLE